MKIKHVLLIDDNEMDNYISEFIINENDAAEKITTKTSAVDAIAYLETVKGNATEFPNLIFLDIRMPAMDGFGFLDEFTKFPEAISKQCTVVMLSSSNDPDDIKRALSYPIVKKFLTKPLEQEALESVLML